MVHYTTTNEFCVAPMRYGTFSASHIKQMRDDFDDMFDAECVKRQADGDLSVVFTLTYNDEHITHKYGQNLLNADNLKVFSKSSRFAKMLRRKYGFVFDMLSVGEYGNGGESHHYVGVRGRGQNPHYHCAGWFHKVEDVEGVENCSIWHNGVCVAHGLVEVLPMLLRLEWQKCVESDPVVYGRNKFLRSLGFGYVRLQGPIQSKRGGTYISKYIGKDIGNVFFTAYSRSLCPTIYCRLLNVCKSFGLHDYECQTMIKCWLDYLALDIDYLNFEIYEFRYYYDTLDVFKSAPLPIIDRLEVFDALHDSFYAIYNSFNDGMRTVHSPKVRKFHGFGYSLLDSADLLNGTYTLTKKCGEVTRFLPPSLFRKAYYTYNVRYVVDGVHRGEKSVCYTLNEAGRTFLREKLFTQLQKDFIVLSDKIHSQFLRPAILFHRCLSSYWPSVDVFDEIEFVALLSDVGRAVEYAVNCRQFSCYGIAEKDCRCFVNVRDWLAANSAPIYKTLLLVEKELFALRVKKDEKDAKHNAIWFKCFDYNY